MGKKINMFQIIEVWHDKIPSLLKGYERRAKALWQTFTGNMVTSLSMWNTYTVYNLSSLLRNYLPLTGEKFETPYKNDLDLFIHTSLIITPPPLAMQDKLCQHAW